MWINADLGEGCAHDETLFKIVDWANIASGGHAGDEHSIRRACVLALEHGVQVGAHPSYPDRAGFGRQKPDGSTAQLLGELKRQMDFSIISPRNWGVALPISNPTGITDCP